MLNVHVCQTFPLWKKRYVPKDFTGVIKSMQTSKQTNNVIKCSLYADLCCTMSCFGWIEWQLMERFQKSESINSTCSIPAVVSMLQACWAGDGAQVSPAYLSAGSPTAQLCPGADGRD